MHLHWSNCRPTRTIVPHSELLNRHPCFPCYLSREEPCDTIRGISLIRIRFYNDTSVHTRGVVLLVLGGVVRVDGVRHVH